MMISTAAIDIPPGRRPVVPEKVDELASSFLEVGILAPPIVYANPEFPGRYTTVAGVHRLLAALKLGIDQIDVRVTDADDIHREMMELSENIHRNEFSLADRDRAMARYAALYLAIHPELADMLSRKTANLRRGKDPAPARAPEAAPAPADAIAATFGVSRDVARRALHRGGIFTDEQHTVLEALGLSLEDRDRVAAIKDPADRDQVIALLATNLSLDDALLEVVGDAADDADGDIPDPAEQPPAELTDEEWLDTLPIRGRCNRPLFDADALLYRELQAARQGFELAIGWGERRKRLDAQGVYYRRLARYLSAPHPRHWVVCHNCSRGVAGGGQPCQPCKGGGYLIG